MSKIKQIKHNALVVCVGTDNNIRSIFCVLLSCAVIISFFWFIVVLYFITFEIFIFKFKRNPFLICLSNINIGTAPC